MIKIKSKKELTFDPVSRVTGIIEVEITSYQRNVASGNYTLNLTDSVLAPTEVEMPTRIPPKYNEDGTVKEPERWENVKSMHNIKQYKHRSRTYTDAELDTLIGGMDLDLPISIENIDLVFQQGLLYITQAECEQGKGIYFSEAEDWEVSYT